MRNRIFAYILATVALAGCSRTPEYPNRAAAIAAQMHDPHSQYVVVACHRGDWRNFPENSISAIESVIRYGADIMELDLKMTKDSVLVLSHDYDVKRCTNFRKVFAHEKGKSAKIKDLTMDEIRQLSLCRAHGIAIDTVKMPTLRQALLCCKDRICVNVDQGYEYYDQVLAIAEELGVTEQILIKSRKPLDVVAAHEAKYRHNMMYMPIIDLHKKGGAALLDSYLDRNVVPLAYELCWKENDGSFADACRRIIAQGSKVWVNTIWASLCGGDGNDDDAAYMAADPGEVYQQYLDNGVSMIQTDRPELLIHWLSAKGRHKLPSYGSDASCGTDDCAELKRPQTGDLLFVGIPFDYSAKDMASAISSATGDSSGINFIHTAILEVEDGRVWIIDATIKHGVARYPLEEFLRDFTMPDGSYPHFEVLRLKDNSHAADYVARAKTFAGESYDKYFLHDNGMHYCTELVYDSYIEGGKHVFCSVPMNFRDSDGNMPEYWTELFQSIGAEIPQDKPGTNPAQMHASELLIPTDFEITEFVQTL